MSKHTKAEREHMARIQSLGCIACLNMGIEDSAATIHHITHGSHKDHFKVIPVCPRHHFAWFDTGIHAGLKSWEQRHGTEAELLEQVLSLLE